MIDLPAGWVMTRLSDVAEVRLGRQRSPKNHSGTHMRPYLRAANIDWDGLKLDDVKEMNFSDAELAVYRLETGDLLLNEASGSPDEVGKPALWNGTIEDCCFQNTLIRVRTHGTNVRFLLHFFRSQALSGAFARMSRGVGIHHIGSATLADWLMPIPPLAEQGRIVEALEDHLSRLDAGNALLASAHHRSLALAASTLAALWREAAATSGMRRLAEVGQIITGATPNSRTSGNSGNDVMFVTPGDVGRGEAIRSTARMLSTVGAERSRVADSGAVLTVCIGATLGKVGWTSAPAAMNQQINAVKPVSSVATGRYLTMMISSPAFQREMHAAASTTTMPLLNKSRFSKLQLPVPSLDDQASLLSRWDAIHEATIGLMNQSRLARRRAVVCRRSLLERAFSGRLVPQDPSDEPASVLLDRLNAEQAAVPKPARRRTRTG